MAITVSKDGLYFPAGTNDIKWSQLRDTFKREAPSEPQGPGAKGNIIAGAISASDLLRETDRSNENPYVPDCTENNDVGSSTNWKVSQMRDTIKYYWVTATGTNDEFDIDQSASWNNNIDKTIVKRLYVEGDMGTNNTGNYAARLSVRSCNLTIDMKSGSKAYGAGGSGGNPHGANGGDAIRIDDSLHENVRIWVRSGAEIYGGGGGGGKGSTGANGSSGTCWDWDYKTVGSGCGWCGDCGSGWERYGGCNSGSGCNCAGWGWWYGCRSNNLSSAQCRQKDYTTIAGGVGGHGGNGGHGRGHNHLSGSLSGASGQNGTGWAGCGGYDGTGNSGSGGANGQTGGSGGTWGEPGYAAGVGSGGAAGRAVSGANYGIHGTINSNTVKGYYQP